VITSPTALLRASLALLVFSLPVLAMALGDITPPNQVIVSDDFMPLRAQWLPVSGAWSVSAGTYNSTAAGSNDITRVVHYPDIDPVGEGQPALLFERFTVSARMRIGGTGDGTVGLVYAFQDSANYYEALLSSNGTVSLRRTRFGSTNQLVSIDLRIQRGVWYLVAIKSDHGSNTLSINGLPVFSDVRQPELTGGQVGLVTHSVVGQFDKMLTTTPIGDQPFKDDFTSDAPGWTSQSGQWNVANGTYNNGAVQQTSITLAPIHTDHQVQSDRTSSFTVRARMVNPYANAGNLVGLVFNYGAASYSEVVFSPTGVAKMNRVTNGTVQTLATATYNGRRNVWFDVTLDSTPSVWVDGEKIFDHVTAANPDNAPAGDVGLITHWAPGRFDDVWFDHGVFRSSCSESFASGPVPETVSGTWTVNAGTLNATSVNAGSIALPCRESDIVPTDFVYSARMLNPYSASGNLVGLIFNYQPPFTLYAGDYYELVFAPNGSGAFLNKIIQGVRYRVGTFPHHVPAKTWFDVQLTRSGIYTTIKVNGATIARDVPQADLPSGRVGVVTHWSPGRFDDLSLEPSFSRSGPVSYTITHIATPPLNSENGQFFIKSLNNDGEVSGSRVANGQQQAFTWHAGTFRNLNPLLASDVFGAKATVINNLHEVIGGYEDSQFHDHSYYLSAAGQLISLTNVPSAGSALIDLNDQHQILLSEGSGVALKNFIWRSGQLTPLQELPTANTMTAVALNNLGVATGYASLATPVLWENGTVMQLTLPAPASDGMPVALNDHNAVAIRGFIRDRSPARVATYVWHEGEATLLMPAEGTMDQSVPYDINNRGVVVGQSFSNAADETATVWDGTRGQALETLIKLEDPLRPFVHLQLATFINGPGQIVAQGIDSRRTDGLFGYYLLTPVAQQ
jgi:hypothetical protein